MTVNGVLEANKDIARRFVSAFNARDLEAIDALLADDFVWHTAITGEGETEPRRFQSSELRGKLSPLGAPFKNKRETLGVFDHLFANGERDEKYHFGLRLVSLTAEDDRVALEMDGDARNPANDRYYRNIYFVLMRITAGEIVLYKEYQDTLHVYDVWAAM